MNIRVTEREPGEWVAYRPTAYFATKALGGDEAAALQAFVDRRNQQLQDRAEALAFVNTVRASSGAPGVSELQPGDRGSSCGCPIARTLGGPAGYDGVALGGAWTETTPPVKRFMLDFDGGAHPDLDIEKEDG